MDKNELERRLEAAEKQNLGLLDEIKNLKAQFAEMQDEPEIPDIPEFESPEVWVMASNFEVFNCQITPYSYLSFNTFHTKEMAQEFAQKCKLIAMMLHCKWYLCPDYVPDFADCNEEKYYVYYDACAERYTTDWRVATIENEVFFNTKENAQKCADWLNEHWRKNDEESV